MQSKTYILAKKTVILEPELSSNNPIHTQYQIKIEIKEIRIVSANLLQIL
jgi:hypothetical protein